MQNLNRKPSPEQREELLRTLKSRFESNMIRHERLDWSEDVYHNGAESYYAVRGFRGLLRF